MRKRLASRFGTHTFQGAFRHEFGHLVNAYLGALNLSRSGSDGLGHLVNVAIHAVEDNLNIRGQGISFRNDDEDCILHLNSAGGAVLWLGNHASLHQASVSCPIQDLRPGHCPWTIFSGQPLEARKV